MRTKATVTIDGREVPINGERNLLEQAGVPVFLAR